MSHFKAVEEPPVVVADGPFATLEDLDRSYVRMVMMFAGVVGSLVGCYLVRNDFDPMMIWVFVAMSVSVGVAVLNRMHTAHEARRAYRNVSAWISEVAREI